MSSELPDPHSDWRQTQPIRNEEPVSRRESNEVMRDKWSNRFAGVLLGSVVGGVCIVIVGICVRIARAIAGW